MKKLLLSMLCAASMTAYAGTGTADDPYSVAEVIAMGADLNVASASVKGYIVGYVEGAVISTGAHFDLSAGASAANPANLLMADAASCTDVAQCIPVQLKSGSAIRSALNLKDNPDNLGKGLTITGQLIKYFGVPGLKEPTAYILEGEGGGGSGDDPVNDDPVTALDETFEGGSIPANWSQVQVAGNKAWYVTSFSGNSYAAMTGYKGTAPFDQWLLTPAIDMSKVPDKTLSFDTEVNGYGSTTSVFEVYVLESNDVNGSKTKLNPTLAEAPASGYSQWVSSGNIDLSAYNGIIYIGFRYYATTDDNYATWCLDNVRLGEATPIVAKDVASIAEFLALEEGTLAKINCPVTAVYQNGSYLYITDGTTPMLVYGSLGKTYKNGDVIAAGITGTFVNFSQGQLQMGSPDATTFSDPTEGTPVTADIYQVEELSADMVSAYVKILGATVTAGTDAKTFTLSDNTGEITMYNQFGVEAGAGTDCTFVGFVGIHSGALQVLPIEAIGEDGGDTPPTPDDPNVAYFIAPTFEGKTGCALINKDGSTTLTNDDTSDETKGLNGKEFTEKGVSLVFSHGTGQNYASSFGEHVRWYQGEIATITPAADVTITKVFVQTAANSKGAFTANVGTVEGTGVGVSNPITWTGSTTEPLELTSAKQIRFSYIEVTTSGFSGVENVTVSDENAPVEYYNLQGIRVANPEGGVYIRRQGNTVTKVLVK